MTPIILQGTADAFPIMARAIKNKKSKSRALIRANYSSEDALYYSEASRAIRKARAEKKSKFRALLNAGFSEETALACIEEEERAKE